MKEIARKYIVYVILDIYPCATGGMEIFYNKLLPEFAKTEKVALITTCKKIEATRYKIFRIPRDILSIPGSGRLGTMIFTALTLIKLRNKIKIVHFPYTSNAGRWGLVFPLLKKYFWIPYLLHIHGGGMKPWKKFNADKYLFRYADKVLAVSEIIKDEYENRADKRIEVVYPLVPFQQARENRNEIRRKFGFNQEAKILLFVGSLKELKAPDILFEAFNQMGEEFIETHRLKLIFIGDGPLRESLASNASIFGLKNHVVFTGKIPYSEVPRYYKIADIYIIPSLFEGTPKALLEAMYNQVPVVGSSVNGISNVITHLVNGLLFQPGDALDLKEKIVWMVKNQEKAAKLAKTAQQQFSRQYEFHSTLKRLKAVYKS